MKFYQSGRSIFRKMVQMRSYFATTCTTIGTRGAKLPADVTFSGRSMVEMLGVLAIIGVLSVGAISGYSKAMMKYKLNKSVEQISTLINYAFIHFSDLRPEVTEATSLLPYMQKLNAIPEGMIYETKNDSLNGNDALKTTAGQYVHFYIGGPTRLWSNVVAINYSLSREQVDYFGMDISNEIYLCSHVLQTVQSLYYQNPELLFRVQITTPVENDELCCRNKNNTFKDMSINDFYNICSQHINKDTKRYLLMIALFDG